MKTTITTPARANIALAKGNNDRIVFPCRSQCWRAECCPCCLWYKDYPCFETNRLVTEVRPWRLPAT